MTTNSIIDTCKKKTTSILIIDTYEWLKARAHSGVLQNDFETVLEVRVYRSNDFHDAYEFILFGWFHKLDNMKSSLFLFVDFRRQCHINSLIWGDWVTWTGLMLLLFVVANRNRSSVFMPQTSDRKLWNFHVIFSPSLNSFCSCQYDKACVSRALSYQLWLCIFQLKQQKNEQKSERCAIEQLIRAIEFVFFLRVFFSSATCFFAKQMVLYFPYSISNR